MLRTRSPLGLPEYCYSMDPVRLACVKHAASVRPEPGSNSPTRTVHDRTRAVGRIDCVRDRVLHRGIADVPALRSDYDLPSRLGPRGLYELTDSIQPRPEADVRAARTGVQSSLPFSRSRSSDVHSLEAHSLAVGASFGCRFGSPEREQRYRSRSQVINLVGEDFSDDDSRACPCGAARNRR